MASSKRRTLAEREAERFTTQSSHYPRRAKAVTPELEELKTMSFTEYVQHALFDDEGSSSGSDGEDEENSGSKNGKEEMPPRKISWEHGVVKITLPKGWWDEAGIAKDRTARGPEVSILCTISKVLPDSAPSQLTSETHLRVVARRNQAR